MVAADEWKGPECESHGLTRRDQRLTSFNPGPLGRKGQLVLRF